MIYNGNTKTFGTTYPSFVFIPYTETTYGVYMTGKNNINLISGSAHSAVTISVENYKVTIKNSIGWHVYVYVLGV